MGTLQTELAKLPSLESLSFDDDDAAPTIVVDEAKPTTLKRETKRESIWRYIRNNPGSTAAEIAKVVELEIIDIYRAVHAMCGKGLLAKHSIAGVHHYSVTSDTYPRYDRRTALAKAREKRLEMLRAIKNDPVAVAKVMDTVAKQVSKPTNHYTPAAPSLDPHNIGSWPLSTARAVYNELKRYFDENRDA